MRLILALIGMLVAVIFAVQNAMPVTIKVFFWQLEASLAVVVAVCFALGAIVAAFAVMPEIYKRRSGEKRLQARLATMQSRESTPTRAAPMPSSTSSGNSPH